MTDLPQDAISRSKRQREIAAAAGELPRGRINSGVRALVAVCALSWAAVTVWCAVTLPDRVPMHWSGSGVDRWGGRTEALLFLLGFGAASFLLPLLSRLATAWPDGINVRDKDWWLRTPERLREFERRLRGDLWVVTASMLLTFALVGVVMNVAAHRPNGAVPLAWVVSVALPVLLAVAYVVWHSLTGYRPEPEAATAATPGSSD